MTRVANIHPYATTGRPQRLGYIHHSKILQCSVFGVQCSMFSPRTHQSVPQNNWYIYHSDHLGSSAFLTDAGGTPTQHLQYLPFGEPFIEQRSVTEYYTPYTFSAKERDLETGYSYFGARYYDAGLSIWLSACAERSRSMDPMADKFPNESPYMYVSNNPILYIDPDGREKIYGFDRNNPANAGRLIRFRNYRDDNAIYIFSHGIRTGLGISPHMKGNDAANIITTPEQMVAFLDEHSEVWRNRTEGEIITLVLMSCNTAIDLDDGNTPFAQQLAESELFENVVIIAADEQLWGGRNYKGVYPTLIGSDGEPILTTEGQRTQADYNNPGNWRIFFNGQERAQISGTWLPRELPTFLFRWFLKPIDSSEN
jgi:RHS repeat-associated protein